MTPTGPKTYFATDHVEDRRYQAIELTTLLEATRDAGLDYDAATGKGIVLHMLRALRREGRVSAVAIADTAEEANKTYLQLTSLMDELAANARADRAPLREARPL